MQDAENQPLTHDASPSEPLVAVSLPAKRNAILFNENGLRAGWRLLLFLLLLRLILIPLAFAAARPLRHNLEPIFGNIADVLLLACILLATAIMSKIERHSWLSYGLRDGGAFFHFSSGTLTGFLSLSFILLGLLATHHLSFGAQQMHGSKLMVAALVNLIGFLVVGLFEETALRGYMLYTLTDGIGFWPAAVIMSLLFAGLHLQNPGETKVGIAAVFAFGMMLAFSLWRTGSLLWAIGFHSMWDYSESFLYGVPDSGIVQPDHLLTATLKGPAWITGGTVGPEGSWFIFVLLAALALMIHLAYPRRRQFVWNRLIGPSGDGAK